jgi:predicted P-loop ATPase
MQGRHHANPGRPQGIGKSRAAQILAGEWFSDELADLTSKDASMQVAAAWIIEIAELDAMHRAEVTRLKAFLSRRDDRFRPPYGRRVIEVPRHSVFLGTTNADVYLNDGSGGRRFWPVKVGTIDHTALERDRDQLWGEAVACFTEGVPWWITNKIIARDAKNEQDKRYVTDPWDEAIALFLETRNETSVQEILQDLLHLPIAGHDQKQQNRVAKSLQHLGWLRRQRRVDGKQTYRYFRSDVTTSG